MDVRPGFHTITPYVVIARTDEAIAFYQRVFGAELTLRDIDDKGRVRHAEIRIGDSHIMFCGDFPEYGMMRTVEDFKGSPVQLFLYVEDADSWFHRAVEAGASVVLPLETRHYGRGGGIKDPFGLTWWINTHAEATA